jgi:hypothetical protein
MNMKYVIRVSDHGCSRGLYPFQHEHDQEISVTLRSDDEKKLRKSASRLYNRIWGLKIKESMWHVYDMDECKTHNIMEDIITNIQNNDKSK